MLFRMRTFFNVFYFHLNVYYIYVLHHWTSICRVMSVYADCFKSKLNYLKVISGKLTAILCLIFLKTSDYYDNKQQCGVRAYTDIQ